MIARLWRGRTTPDNAPYYRRHAIEKVFPSLINLPGHCGAHLLMREVDGNVEFLAVTLWNSLESVKAFASEDPNVAVVEPEARAILSDFDDFATHYVLVDTPTGSLDSVS